MFGNLPKLPYQDHEETNFIIPYGKTYKGNIDKIDIQGSVKTIDERKEILTEKFPEYVQWAERLFFLGFGFADENLELLDLREEIGNNRNIQIFGTRHLMDERDMERTDKYFRIEKELHGQKVQIKPNFIQGTSIELLKKYL